MTTKITLDADALELLFKTLGPDFILKIRQATLEEVAGRTVNRITTAEVKKCVEATTMAELNKYIEPVKVKSSWSGYDTVPQLKESAKKLITSTAKAEVEKLINDAFDRDEIKKKMESLITYHADVLKSQVERYIKENMNETLINTEVSRRLREIAAGIAGSK